MGLYTGKLGDLKALKEGSTVAIPNDPTNQARALLMLQDLGWLTLKEGINPLKASEFDVVKNPHDIKLVLLEAAQLPRSREDVDFSVINGNFAASSGIPFSEGLSLERSYDFINWVVLKSADADKPFAKDVITAYNSPSSTSCTCATGRQYQPLASPPSRRPKSVSLAAGNQDIR